MAYLSLAADQRGMENIVYINVFSTFYRKRTNTYSFQPFLLSVLIMLWLLQAHSAQHVGFFLICMSATLKTEIVRDSLSPSLSS